MSEMRMKALRFAKCRPNLMIYREGEKFDVYVCGECKKLWSVLRPNDGH